MKQRAYVLIMVVPEESEWEISCAYELAILGDEPSHAFLI